MSESSCCLPLLQHRLNLQTQKKIIRFYFGQQKKSRPAKQTTDPSFHFILFYLMNNKKLFRNNKQSRIMSCMNITVDLPSVRDGR